MFCLSIFTLAKNFTSSQEESAALRIYTVVLIRFSVTLKGGICSSSFSYYYQVFTINFINYATNFIINTFLILEVRHVSLSPLHIPPRVVLELLLINLVWRLLSELFQIFVPCWGSDPVFLHAKHAHSSLIISVVLLFNVKIFFLQIMIVLLFINFSMYFLMFLSHWDFTVTVIMKCHSPTCLYQSKKMFVDNL